MAISSHEPARETMAAAGQATLPVEPARETMTTAGQATLPVELAPETVVETGTTAAGQAGLPEELARETVVETGTTAAGQAGLPEELARETMATAGQATLPVEPARETVVETGTTSAGQAGLPEELARETVATAGQATLPVEPARETVVAAGQATLPARETVIEIDTTAAGQQAGLPEDRQTMDAGMTRPEDDSNGSGRISCTASLCQLPGPMDARYIYAVIFLIGDVWAWVLRENPKAFFEVQRLSGCHGDRDCLASEAVLMVSFANFLFFSTMGLSTLYTKMIHDCRSSWHSGWWPAKIMLLLVCYITPILVPDYFLQLYGKIAPFGAGLFLIVQLISVIRYVTRMNSRWCGQANFDNHRRKVIAISILSYGLSTSGIVLMVFWYVGLCQSILALVVTTLGLVYIMPLISLLTKAKGFYMEPLLMGVYIVFLCWSAIKSDPRTSCYKKENTSSGANWITIVSFIAELASVTVAAFSTGTDYKCIQFSNVVESENDVPYGYGFFHFVFATGSMYYGMLFLGWDTHRVLGKWSMDVGWTSTTIHIVNEGLAVIFFVLVILARSYGVGWLQQLLGKFFGTGGQQLADESNASNIELARFNTDNNAPPQQSPATRQEGSPTNNDDELPRGPGTSTEPVRSQRDDNAHPPSSSSSTPTLHTSEPQAPTILRRRRWGEIDEEW